MNEITTIATIPGIGPIIATAVAATVVEASEPSSQNVMAGSWF